MRYYFIDEISLTDMERIEKHMNRNARKSKIDKIFWVEMPKEILNEVQSRHRECQPYLFSNELGRGWIKIELFARTLKGLNCHCQSYCTPEQSAFILNFTGKMIDELGIRT